MDCLSEETSLCAIYCGLQESEDAGRDYTKLNFGTRRKDFDVEPIQPRPRKAKIAPRRFSRRQLERQGVRFKGRRGLNNNGRRRSFFINSLREEVEDDDDEFSRRGQNNGRRRSLFIDSLIEVEDGEDFDASASVNLSNFT